MLDAIAYGDTLSARPGQRARHPGFGYALARVRSAVSRGEHGTFTVRIDCALDMALE